MGNQRKLITLEVQVQVSFQRPQMPLPPVMACMHPPFDAKKDSRGEAGEKNS